MQEGKAASNLATYALQKYKAWEEAIDAWQKPVSALDVGIRSGLMASSPCVNQVDPHLPSQ